MIRCPCGATVEEGSEIRGNIGDIARVTGYTPMHNIEGYFQWLCPVCWAKCADLLRQVGAVLGPTCLKIYTPNLLRRAMTEKEDP